MDRRLRRARPRRLAGTPLRRRAVPMVLLALVAAGLRPGPGLVPAAGAATALSIASEADATTAAAQPHANFGSAATLAADKSPQTEAYLRFAVPALTGAVDRARLRLYVQDATGNGPKVYGVATAWSEAGLTWATRPVRTGPMADKGSLKAGTVVEYDVTAMVGGPGPVAFGLVPDVTDGAVFPSREAPTHRPELIVDVGPPASFFAPVADARVAEGTPGTNFGTDPGLGAQTGTGTSTESYLRFDVAGLSAGVLRARLRLFAYDGTTNGPGLRAAPDGWTETAINWSNRPGPVGSVVADRAALGKGWVEYDVTSLIPGNGVVNLALLGQTADAFGFRSREGAADQRPQLVIETGGPLPTSSTTTTTEPPTTTTTTLPGVNPQCAATWGTANQVGMYGGTLSEMSGLAASQSRPGWGWGIRDSGNPASLYSFSLGETGVVADEFPVDGLTNSDWEDVAYSPGPEGGGLLWILENVGNSWTGDRWIYQVQEPDPTTPGPAQLLGRYEWAYPDVQSNSETLFVFDGHLVVVSKTSPSRVYRFEGPLLPLTVNVPVYVGTLAEGANLSDAALSPDERTLAVASHDAVYVYENRFDASDLATLVGGSPVYRQSMASDNREGGSFFPYGSCDIVLVAESKRVWRLDHSVPPRPVT